MQKDKYTLILVAHPDNPWNPTLYSILKNDEVICEPSEEDFPSGYRMGIDRVKIPTHIAKELKGKIVKMEQHSRVYGDCDFYEMSRIVHVFEDTTFGMRYYPTWLFKVTEVLFGVNKIAYVDIHTWRFIAFMKLTSSEPGMSEEDMPVANHKVLGFHFEWNWKSRKKDPANKIYWKPALNVRQDKTFWSFAFLGIQFGMFKTLDTFNLINARAVTHQLKAKLKNLKEQEVQHE